jgi:peptide/nickel transport system ATP-binding protein
VSVLKRGRVVEAGPVREIFSRPEHPYTQALLDAIPALPGR